MATRFNLRLDGIENLMEGFNLLGDQIDDVVKEALEESIKPMVDDMKSMAPFDTGALREGIQSTKVREDGTGLKISAGVIWEHWPGAGVPHENPELFYAVFQEFGTVNHPAQPFIIPAYEKNKTKSSQIIKDVIKRRLGLK